MKPTFKILAAALAGATLLPAGAASFDFANLTYNGVVNAGFLPLDGVACTGGDLCSSNVDGGVRNGDLTFASGGLTVVASATFNDEVAAVVQDHENGYNSQNKIGAGLGVYHLSGNSSDDNITTGERLVMTFDQVVHLTSISLRSEGHNVTSWTPGATFRLNGVNTLLPAGSGDIALDLTGQSFSFRFGGMTSDQFYLSGMTAVAAVPEPETYAMMLAGLSAIAFVARRRRPLS